MARKGIVYRDPWLDLVALQENRQVDLGEVFIRLSLSPQAREATKRALLQRIAALPRTRPTQLKVTRH
jgi:hypothetical protein